MVLTSEQKIAYLANMVFVARADSIIAPSESASLQRAQKQIGATKAALRKAELAAEVEGFAPAPVGPFSAKVANLEDMVRVAIADGKIDDAEKPAILAFAKQIGLTNEQLQLIASEVKQEEASPEAKRKCPACAADVARAAKFCPQCGVALEEAEEAGAVAVDYRIPSDGIAIEFPESTASGFTDAVRKAAGASQYAECVKGRKKWYMAAWPLSRIGEAAALVRDLKGMRNRKVWIDGTESRWDDVFGFTWCSDQRDGAYRPVSYCFGVDEKRLNLWGCKNTRLDWVKWSDLFSCGQFRKGGLLKGGHVFVFDKKRIRHEIETNLFRFRFCPYLNFKLIEAVLKAFPDQVDVSPNGDWTYKQDYDESPGSVRVRLKEVEDGYTFTNEFYSSGAVPKSPTVGIAILRKAIKSIGADDSVLQEMIGYSGD